MVFGSILAMVLGGTLLMQWRPLPWRFAAFGLVIAMILNYLTPVELLAEILQEAERGLVRCRQEMTAAQIESVERQFQKKRLYEHYGIPRLSLFYF